MQFDAIMFFKNNWNYYCLLKTYIQNDSINTVLLNYFNEYFETTGPTYITITNLIPGNYCTTTIFKTNNNLENSVCSAQNMMPE